MKPKPLLLFALLQLIFLNTTYSQKLEWAKILSGGSNENRTGSQVDLLGNVYVFGRLDFSIDLDPGPGTDIHVNNGELEGQIGVYVSKLNSSGDFVWGRSWDGKDCSIYANIQVDDSQNVYLYGTFYGKPDFDPGPDSAFLNFISGSFICKIDPTGNFLWVKPSICGLPKTAVKADKAGNLYCAGELPYVRDVDPGPDSLFLTSNGYSDAFLTKFDSDGNLAWAKSIGSAGVDAFQTLAFDRFENVYTGGVFSDTIDADPGSGVSQLYAEGTLPSVFVVKWTRHGDYVWSNSYGNYGTSITAMDCDSNSNLYVTGTLWAPADLAPGLPNSYFPLKRNSLYVTLLDSNGNFVWVKAMQTNTGVWHSRFFENPVIRIDTSENIQLAGKFAGRIDFDLGADSFFMGFDSSRVNVFLLKLHSDGLFANAFQFYGGREEYRGSFLTFDGNGNLYVAGNSQLFEDSLKYLSALDTLILAAKRDPFVFKISALGDIPAKEPPAPGVYHIYPNPNTGILTIETGEEALVSIYNATGQNVYTSIAKKFHSIHDLSSLSNGIYFIRFESNGKYHSERLIVVR